MTFPVRSIAEVSLGRQRSPKHEHGPHQTRYLRAANVKDRRLDLSDVKQMNFTPAEQEAFRLLPGDVLVSEGAGSLRAVGAAADWNGELSGTVCFQNTLLRLRPKAGTHRGFLSWWATFAFTSGLFASAAQGVNIHHLSAERVRRLRVAVVDANEQHLIAEFLDRETERIDAVVAAKRRMIELLDEERTALITHTVTKGLDPTVPMKDSGIPWLGDIPAHWDAGPLGRWWSVIDCKHWTAQYVEAGNGIPIVGTPDIRHGRLDLSRAKNTTHQDFAQLVANGRRPRRHDIIYSRNASLGQASYVDTEAKFCMGQDVCLIRSSQQNQLFLMYQLAGAHITSQLEVLVVGATFKRINVEQIRRIRLVRPPLSEQADIAAALDLAWCQHSLLTTTLTAQLTLLAEYRQALITAAVTGRLSESVLRGEVPIEEAVEVPA